jgi:hypothetical protein
VTQLSHVRSGWAVIPIAIAGLVATAGCRDDLPSPTESEPASALSQASATLSFLMISAGDFHTCGVAANNRAPAHLRRQSDQCGLLLGRQQSDVSRSA